MPVKREFFLVPIAKIKVAERQRKRATEIEDLALSISRHGLLHPIVITRNLELVVGERRLRAFQWLQEDHIPAQFLDELDEFEAKAVELEENVKRVNLIWQDECEAVLRYHEHRTSKEPNWSIEMTADTLGIAERQAYRKIRVAHELRSGNERVATCDTMGAALNVIDRDTRRSVDSEVSAFIDAARRTERVSSSPSISIPQAKRDDVIRPAELDVFVKDFHEAVRMIERPYNFVHLDPPYGINHDKSDQGSALQHGAYGDSYEAYVRFIRTLGENRHLILSSSSHVMLWFSMSFYRETLEMLEHYFPDAHIDPFPLIWFKSDNTGILPDPRRGPRRIYETAFYFSIGDRLITRATNNVVACAANKEQARHLSEKPRGVLSYFFKMFIDENTSFFDPCCGAGSSLEAAELAGAESIQGWDVDPEYVTLARELLTKSRIMRSGGLEILADMKKNATDTSEES